jgi:hypothetical protein
MSLLSAMPGLAVHETNIPPLPPPVTVAFDDAAAYEIIRCAVRDVALSFPAPDPWGWLTKNRPDVIAELKKSGDDMNVAYLASNMEQVKKTADRFVRIHKRAWQIYEQRPPVIEIQDELMLAAA